MFCRNCGTENEENVAFCAHCGAPVNAASAPAQQVPQAPQGYPYPAQPPIPEEYKPLSPWVYFGLQLLFSIPFVGLICLIVFTFDKSNINRRNFVLSYWISFGVGVVLTILMIVFLAALGFTMMDVMDEMMYY